MCHSRLAYMDRKHCMEFGKIDLEIDRSSAFVLLRSII